MCDTCAATEDANHTYIRLTVNEDDEDDVGTTDENAKDGKFRDEDDYGYTDDDLMILMMRQEARRSLRKGKERVRNVWECMGSTCANIVDLVKDWCWSVSTSPDINSRGALTLSKGKYSGRRHEFLPKRKFGLSLFLPGISQLF